MVLKPLVQDEVSDERALAKINLNSSKSSATPHSVCRKLDGKFVVSEH